MSADPGANPFAAPEVEIGGAPEWGRIDIQDALRVGWDGFKTCIGPWFSAGLWLALVGLLFTVVLAGATVASPIAGGVVVVVLAPPLSILFLWGYTLFTLRMADGDAEARDVFDGFRDPLRKLFPMLGLTLLQSFVIPLPGYALSLAAPLMGDELGPIMTGVGGIASLVWNLAIGARFLFAGFFLVDQERGAIDSLQASWNATSGQKLQTVLLIVTFAALIFVGFLMLIFGSIVTGQVGWNMIGAAYRQVSGASPAR